MKCAQLRSPLRKAVAPQRLTVAAFQRLRLQHPCAYGCRWALGVLTYEFLAGVAPFSDPGGDDMKTFASILKGVYRPREGLSPAARSLISGLLQVPARCLLGAC